MDSRFKALTEATAAQLANVNKTALAYVNGRLPEVYSINYNALSQSVDGVGGYIFALVDADTVKNLATTDDSLLPYKQLDENADVRWNVKKMNVEVLQGILQGEPMDKIASRLSKVTVMNETAAIRNARTMVTGAHITGGLGTGRCTGFVYRHRRGARRDAGRPHPGRAGHGVRLRPVLLRQ